MGDHDESDLLVLGQLQHAVQYLLTGFGVQVAGRFISKNDFGIADKGTGDAHTLLLAAAHLSGQVVGAAKQAHAFQFLAGQL